MAATNTAGNQHKADQTWDGLKRIWAAWAIINSNGAFIACITPAVSASDKMQKNAEEKM